MKVKYAIWEKGNREGEFEFLSSTQGHLTSSLKEIREEYEDLLEVEEEEEGLEYVIYKLTMEEVK